MDYLLHLAVFTLIYGMLALSLNVSSGFTRLISLAHAGFFGIGAYTTAILATNYGWPAGVNLLVAAAVAAAVAGPMALVAVRTTGDYFVICTLATGIVLFSAMNNWHELTRGPLGIARIPPLTLFGHTVTTVWEWAGLTGIAYAVMHAMSVSLKKSDLGRVMAALAQDEVYCQSLGKNVRRAKVQAIVTGAVLASVPGVLYAHYVSYIDPTSFTVFESIFVLSTVILGGLGNVSASLPAAAFMVLFPELLRYVGLPSHLAANLQRIVFGTALILLVSWSGAVDRPQSHQTRG